MEVATGTRIGRYQVVARIGVGGMGSVYEAIQDEPRRTVALKLMNAGLESEEAVHRFRYEAEVLAHLDHPGIARILEAGTHVDEDGRPVPWFAMELVAGGTGLVQHADDAGLDVTGRLALFADVCEAVHHGHQRGIIHRDLKPGNILVDATGRPRVIDFGVARSTDLDMARTGALTSTGMLVGTVQYMSPEQCAADPNAIDTRTDVYSLGVVLFELLCGQLPYAFDSVLNAVWVITRETPARPSKLNPRLSGDVEAILLKALEKEPDRRYPSAAALATDLRRFLRREPIAARTPSLGYHLRAVARRHRGLTGAVIAVTLALVAGVTATTWQWRSAVRAAQEAEAVSDFLRGMLPSHTSMDPTQLRVPVYGSESLVSRLLDDGVAALPDAFAGQPALEASTRITLSGGYWGIGLYARAEEEALAATRAREELFGPGDVRTLEARAAHAEAIRMQGRWDEAEGLLREILAACEAHPDLGVLHPQTIAVRSSVVFTLWPQQPRVLEFVELGLRTLEQQREVLGTDAFLTRLTGALIAVSLGMADRADEAEQLARQVMEASDRAGDTDGYPAWTARYALGLAAEGHGDLAAAEQGYRASWQGLRGVWGDDHPFALPPLTALVALVLDQERYAEAVPLCTEMVHVARTAFGVGHPMNAWAEGALVRATEGLAGEEATAP